MWPDIYHPLVGWRGSTGQKLRGRGWSVHVLLVLCNPSCHGGALQLAEVYPPGTVAERLLGTRGRHPNFLGFK